MYVCFYIRVCVCMHACMHAFMYVCMHEYFLLFFMYLCECLFLGIYGISYGPVNECADAALNNCHANAVCTDTFDSFTCVCKKGFSGSGTSCTNVDECSTSSQNNCHANAVCTDTSGSFTCACKKGFSGNGNSCTAVASNASTTTSTSLESHSLTQSYQSDIASTCPCRA